MGKKIVRVNFERPLYISHLDEYEFPDIMIKQMESLYPNFKNWLYKKVLPEVNELKRSIIWMKSDSDTSNSLISAKACLILKKTSKEKKICTIWINNKLIPESDYSFYISALIDVAIKELKTDMPLITISSKCKNLDIYKKVFNDYGFILIEEKNNYYMKGSKEYCYNGDLS